MSMPVEENVDQVLFSHYCRPQLRLTEKKVRKAFFLLGKNVAAHSSL